MKGKRLKARKILLFSLSLFLLVSVFTAPTVAVPITTCQEINVSGNYQVMNDLYGNLSTPVIGQPCLKIRADDVYIDGGGHSLTGCENCTEDNAIFISDWTDEQIHNVNIENLNIINYSVGISLSRAENCTIEAVDLSGCQFSLVLDESEGINFISDTVTDAFAGIYIQNSNSTNVFGNTVTNSDYGIYNQYSENSNIQGNHFYDNWKGIFLKSSSGNMVRDNFIERSERAGIYIKDSDQNTIFNNFLKNEINADFENAGTDTWNTTKSSGVNIISGQYLAGNYWSEPNGTGYSQTCEDLDQDGICDTQYNLSTSNIDYLPLTNNTGPSPAPEIIAYLGEDWNLFSTPVLLEDGNSTFLEIFNSSNAENVLLVLSWTGTSWDIPSGSTEVKPLDAYFVKVKEGKAVNITLIPSDSLSTPPARQVNTGVNLIGTAPPFNQEQEQFDIMPLDQALVSIEYVGGLPGYIIVVSPSNNQPGWAYAKGGPVRDLLPFKGYWVVMENGPDTLYGFSTTPLF